MIGDYIGLFGAISSVGSDVQKLRDFGCLCQRSRSIQADSWEVNFGTIINCYATGTVSGAAFVGGLVRVSLITAALPIAMPQQQSQEQALM